MESVQAQVQALAKTASTIADHALRAAFVRHTLLSMPADQVADCFVVAVSNAEARSHSHGQLLQAISLALADESCDGLRDAVRAVLAVRGHTMLARALTQAPPEEEDPAAQRVPDFGKGRAVTLGERKSLARRNDRNLIARVLRDPHPHVIRILLGNPGLTEADVVRLCASRPVMGEVLREVFRSPRWIVRHQVKVALLLNPHTPLDVALQLSPHMTLPELRRAAAANDLGDELKEACRRLLGRGVGVTVH